MEFSIQNKKFKILRFAVTFLTILAIVFSPFIDLITPYLPEKIAEKAETKQAHAALDTRIFITVASDSADADNLWDVPLDWNSASNSIEVIGAGGGGGDGSAAEGGGGGGGGGYGRINNLTLTPGGQAYFNVGASGSAASTSGGNGSPGGDTWFGTSSNTTFAQCFTTGPTGCVSAKGGAGGIGLTAGPASSSGGEIDGASFGTNLGFQGGDGGAGSTTDGAGGGGGAAGPQGAGKNGGTSTGVAGSGGGGAGGGASDVGVAGGADGGDGGPSYNGSGGGGTGGSGGAAGGDGTQPGAGGGGGDALAPGGDGADGQQWTTSPARGSGGGGGGTGDSNTTGDEGGNGGKYGGGGGGTCCNGNTLLGRGGDGIIVITYRASTNSAPTITVDEPDGTADTVVVGQSYTVQYDLADTDNVVTATFWYDVDGAGFDGTKITAGTCGSGGGEGTNQTCTWDTTGVAANTYFVYGSVSDGVNPVVRDYSPGEVTINDGITVSAEGSQTTNLPVNSYDNHTGGAFAFIRNTSTANVTQITLTDTGSINADSFLTNTKLFYKTEGTCSTTIPTDSKRFGAADNWTQRTSSFGSVNILSVDYNGQIGSSSMWIAVGATASMAKSFDGINWSKVASSTFDNQIIRKVAHNKQSDSTARWVAVGDQGRIATSIDGNSWSEIAGTFGSTIIRTVAHNGLSVSNGQWVAAGDSGKISTSNSGLSWRAQTPANSYTGTFTMAAHNGLSGSSGLWVLVGSAGEIQTATNSINWTKRTPDASYTGTFQGIAYGNGLWVAVGNTGEIQTSPDGTTWTRRTPDAGFASNFFAVRHNKSDLWTAVGATGEIQTSPDGITWTAQTPGSSYTGSFNSIAYGHNLWVITGTTTSQLQTSVDGDEFNGSEQVVVSGSMAVGTSKVCLYVRTDIGAASSANTIDIEISTSANITVSAGGVVLSSTPLALSGNNSLQVPTYTQNNFRFYVDTNTEDVVNPWPKGNIDLAEKAVLTSIPAHQALASGSEFRIRINITVGTTNLGSSSQAFKIKYKAATDCSADVVNGWTDVGATTSNDIWKFGSGVTDKTSLTAVLLSDTTSSKQMSYTRANPTKVNRIGVKSGEKFEFDFDIKHNGATANTTYCFKITKSDDTNLDTYNSDSFPKVETAPATADLMRHGKFFANGSKKGFFWADFTVADSAEQPNVVLILADDLSLDIMNSLRNALSGSMIPNIKQYIIDAGVEFTNAFAPISLCCPSRATILTGQYPHNHHVFTNRAGSGGSEASFDDAHNLGLWLQSAGYKTGYVGKYLNLYGLTTTNTYIPPGWDDWQALVDLSTYEVYNYTVNDNGTPATAGSTPAEYQTDALATRSMDFINESTASQPFFLYINPLAPHWETDPTYNACVANPANGWGLSIRGAPRHIGTIVGDDVNFELAASSSANFNEADVSDKPAWVSENALLSEEDKGCLEDSWQSQLESMRALDDLVGKVITRLDVTGVLDNTIVIFTSDNGLHAAEHRLAGKASMYEESIHIPFYVRGPNFPARQVSEAVLLSDIAPTLLEFANGTATKVMDGRSFVSLLKNKAVASWRKMFLVEHWNDPDVSGGWPDQAAVRVVTSGSRRAYNKLLNTASGSDSEYYNLETDPKQLTNEKNGGSYQTEINALRTYIEKFKVCAGSACKALEDTAPF